MTPSAPIAIALVEGRVAAVGPVVVERRRDRRRRPGRAAECRPSGPGGRTRRSRAVRPPRRRCVRGLPPAGDDPGRVDRRDASSRSGLSPATVIMAAGAARTARGTGCGARSIAAVPGRRPRPARAIRVEVPADGFGAGEPAGDVVADMGDGRRSRRRREERVERRHAVGLGGRHGQALADVVQARLADPADPGLERVERREQRGPRRLRASWPPRATWPSVRVSRAPPDQPESGGAEDGVHGGTLGGRRQGTDDVQIHRDPSVAPGRLAAHRWTWKGLRPIGRRDRSAPEIKQPPDEPGAV